jgi:Domain of unknown function (DUF3472)
MSLRIFALPALAAVFLSVRCAMGQHLWWNLEGQKDAVCLYGEITVLATHPGIYYCGANWHPGEPAGGYCGIQHNGPNERRTIFSIWDTTPELHPRVKEADSRSVFNRFGGEGTGAHTHMIWPWQLGETVCFFVQKAPGTTPDTTDALYYIFDNKQKKWLESATITSPDGGKQSVATFGGGLNSFLENFVGKDRTEPKLALYRLWLGPSVEKIKCLTRATGDGKWGQLHDAYFLAEGGDGELTNLFAKLEHQYGKQTFGGKGTNLQPISEKALTTETIKALSNLTRARRVKEK